MKILIIKLRNIGDVLLMTPLIKNLRIHYPEAIIDVLVNEGTEEMLTLNPALNAIYVYRRSSAEKSSFVERMRLEIDLWKKIRSKRYDLAINLTDGERGLFLSKLAGVKQIISQKMKSNPWLNRLIDHPISAMQLKHIVDVNLVPLKTLGLQAKEKKVKIFWDEKTQDHVEHLLSIYHLKSKSFIHIHPVSRWLFKCLDDVTMAKIVDFCQEELKLPVVLTAAPIQKELDKIDSILAYCTTTPVNLAGKLSLKETAALNKQSKFFIGVDTAVMHISAANDIPVLAFFGPSSAFRWGPWDNDLHHTGYNKLRGNQGMGKHQVIQMDWDCVPCNKDGCDGSKVSDCLIKFESEMIKSHIMNFYKKLPRKNV